MLKKILKSSVFFGIFLSSVFAIIHLKGSHIVHIFELKTLDLKFRARGPIPITDKVCIVTVDEKTYQTMGRWPYPRSVMADMLSKLNEYQAKVIAFDAMFTVSDRTGANLLKDLLSSYEKKDNKDENTLALIEKYYSKAYTDKQFSDAIKNSKASVILGYSWLAEEENFNQNYTFDKEYESILSSAINMVTQAHNSHFFIPSGDKNGLVVNLPIIQTSSNKHAYFNAKPDLDGLFRRVPLITHFKSSYFPSLTLKTVEQYYDSNIFLTLDTLGVKILSILDKVDIPSSQYGELLVNFRGTKQTIPHYSLVDLLDEKNHITKHQKILGVQNNIDINKKDAFKNKIVVFGVTAKGVYDLRNTPFEKDFPGVEVHANAIDNILKGDFIKAETNVIEAFVFLFIIISGLIISILLTKLNALFGFLITLILMFTYIYVDIYYIFSNGILVTLFLPLAQLLCIYIGVTLYKYMSEERQKKQIKNAFKQYVSSSIVNEMLKDPSKLKLGGETKELTVLFSDIRNFTSISEKLDAKELSMFLNSFLTPMTDIIINNKGTLDKYMGDAIMAFFGAPYYFDTHPDCACSTTIEMIKGLKEFRLNIVNKDLPFIDVGIGINTGEMSVGNMGSKQIFDYTVMGDNVNLGSRVEGLNKEYGTNIIITEFTKNRLTNNMFLYRHLDCVKVKGKSKPVLIYELIDYFNSDNPYNNKDFIFNYTNAFNAFYKKDFGEAINLFKSCLKIIETDSVSNIFIKRSEHFIDNPPPSNWDGVYTLDHK